MPCTTEHAPQLPSSFCSNKYFLLFFSRTSLLQNLTKRLRVFKVQKVTILDTEMHFSVPQTSLHYAAHSYVFHYPTSWHVSLVQFLQTQQFNSSQDTVHQSPHKTSKTRKSHRVTCIHTSSNRWVRASLMQVQIIMRTFPHALRPMGKATRLHWCLFSLSETITVHETQNE